jgi:AcrR family transcriptional regulator
VAKRRSKVSRKPSVGKHTRERILAGAAEVFGKLGYATARVEDILLAADVSRPTFYKAFDSKDDIFAELSDRHHRDVRERILRSIAGISDPAAQLEATTDAFMRWRAELGPIGRVLDVEARTPGSSIAHHRSKTLEEMGSLIAERMRRAGRDDVDPVLYYGLIAAMERVADLLLSKHPVSEAAVQRAKRSALRILSGSLAAPGDAVPDLPAPPERADGLKLT